MFCKLRYRSHEMLTCVGRRRGCLMRTKPGRREPSAFPSEGSDRGLGSAELTLDPF